jgi:hypothetical protein
MLQRGRRVLSLSAISVGAVKTFAQRSYGHIVTLENADVPFKRVVVNEE